MESKQLFQRACKLIPGGVNSPVRAFSSVGGQPIFIERAQGAFLFDVDGKKYIDFVGSWGPAILGHAHTDVVEAVCKAAIHGLSFGAPCPIEVAIAECVTGMVPWVDKVRMVNSGTEATMSAIRLARGYTDRSMIIKFEGCYHGHSDCLLVKAGSGSLTLGQSSSAGVPEGTVADTLVLPFNDTSALEQAFSNYGDKLATVIVEPIAGNMNLVPAKPEFLKVMRQLCTQYGTVLIFDEVMTGFRVAKGGAVELYGIEPDLACYGKIIGGGMPVGMFAGASDIMDSVAPVGPVYQAGTLSGNPVSMAAGLATLQAISADVGLYQRLENRLETMLSAIQEKACQHGIAFQYIIRGAMFGYFFSEESEIDSFSKVSACNQDRFKKFFHAMLDSGVYLAPSSYESGFISCAHGDEEIEHTVNVASRIFSQKML